MGSFTPSDGRHCAYHLYNHKQPCWGTLIEVAIFEWADIGEFKIPYIVYVCCGHQFAWHGGGYLLREETNEFDDE